jgi:hypothetical protein
MQAPTSSPAPRLSSLGAQYRRWSADPRARVGAIFLAGLLAGWWLLGWWLFPVRWGPANPAHLNADARANYVQLVSESYARDGDLPRARRLLADIDPTTQGVTLLGLARAEGDGGASARGLAAALNLDGPEIQRAATAAAFTGSLAGAGAQSGAEADPAGVEPGAASDITGADASDGLSGNQAPAVNPAEPEGNAANRLALIGRWLAIIALVGAAGAGLLLAASWLRWRSRPEHELLGNSAAGATRDVGPREVTRQSGESAFGQAEPSRPDLDATQALQQGTDSPTGAIASSAAPTAFVKPDQSSAPAPAAARSRGTGGAPPWRPARIELGETIDAQYHEAEHQAIHTWLVYDARGALVGGAGLLAQSIGEVNTLDLWFSDRDDVDQTARTPTVTFVSQSAFNDPVLRARLSDRRLIPAIPGQTAKLETVDLWLEAEVLAVDPAPESQHPSLIGLGLSLTPHPQPGTGLHRAVASRAQFDDAEVSEADESAWTAAMDAEIDEAFDPPRPYNYRKD